MDFWWRATPTEPREEDAPRGVVNLQRVVHSTGSGGPAVTQHCELDEVKQDAAPLGGFQAPHTLSTVTRLPGDRTTLSSCHEVSAAPVRWRNTELGVRTIKLQV